MFLKANEIVFNLEKAERFMVTFDRGLFIFMINYPNQRKHEEIVICQNPEIFKIKLDKRDDYVTKYSSLILEVILNKINNNPQKICDVRQSEFSQVLKDVFSNNKPKPEDVVELANLSKINENPEGESKPKLEGVKDEPKPS